ncbi:MAG: AarF/UbiB family protein [Candidatus Pacearchaeota archaeon]
MYTIPKKLKHNKEFTRITGIQANALVAIDGGAQGSIYEVNNNSVLKLTTDRADARFCQFLKNKNYRRKYLPKIYNVFKVDYYYVIHMEKLQVFEDTITRAQLDILMDGDWKNALQDKAYRKRLAQWSKTDKFSTAIFRFFNFLESIGVTYYDFHEGNIMVRKNGEFVFIDFGFCKSKSREINKTAIRRILE